MTLKPIKELDNEDFAQDEMRPELITLVKHFFALALSMLHIQKHSMNNVE